MDGGTLIAASNGLTNFNESSTRSTKSRITSQSSLLADGQIPKTHDRLGFRRIAKACHLKSLSNWNYDSNSSKFPLKSSAFTKSYHNNNEGGDSSRLETFSLLQITRRHLKRGVDLNESDNVWKTYYDYKAPMIPIDDEKSNDKSAHFTAHDDEDEAIENKHHHEHYTSADEGAPSHGLKKSHLAPNENIVNIANHLEANLGMLALDTFGKRVVQLKNFPPFLGLKSVLAQICGGPLEKIVLHRLDSSTAPEDTNIRQNSKFQLKNCIMELWFLKPQDAADFMNYSKSGLFLTNGFHLRTDWAPSHISGIDGVKSYHEEPLEELEEEMMINGARRCLVLKKFVGKRDKTSTVTKHPSPKTQCSELNLSDIKQDFERFGQILDVTPVISKKLCIAIHYFSTDTAIKVKHEFANQESDLFKKYKEWTLWFGKDPADRACYSV